MSFLFLSDNRSMFFYQFSFDNNHWALNNIYTDIHAQALTCKYRIIILEVWSNNSGIIIPPHSFSVYIFLPFLSPVETSNLIRPTSKEENH